MRDIIAKLLKDLRWRLGPHGTGFRPTKKEMAQWQIKPIPSGWITAGWFGVMGAICLGGCGIVLAEPWAGIPLITVAVLLSLAGVSHLENRLTYSAKLKAYEAKLNCNERFVLLEYARYLQRQLKRSTKDASLGGAAERQRIEGILERLNLLLQEGAGREDWKIIPSKLAQEADAAEALVESYEELATDDLTALDERLPSELRSRLEALEADERSL
ncbi:hypothetical protein JW859_00125 [bacterium]|nr:hypothetical protein [bacterium]